jgi:hypothetical protein
MLTTTASEREVLASFLDFHRAVVLGKVSGLALEQAATRLLPSETTLAGLLKHLAVTERQWFQQVLAGEPSVPGEAEGDPDSSWIVDPADQLESLAEAYKRECDRSRAVLEQHELDELVAHPLLGRVSARWVVVHMIEETARHAGHADILRELTDGTTGVA